MEPIKNPRPAQFKGVHNGKRYHIWTVYVLHNDSSKLCTIARTTIKVHAASATDAIDYVRGIGGGQGFDLPETEFYTYGPKGGETYRYTGWDSYIGAALIGERFARVKQALLLAWDVDGSGGTS